MKIHPTQPLPRRRQQGLTLIELMVGMTLGMLVAVALLRLLAPLLRLLRLLRLLPLLLASLSCSLPLQELGQVLKLGNDPHAAFLIAGGRERARTLDHLLDVLLARRLQLRL